MQNSKPQVHFLILVPLILTMLTYVSCSKKLAPETQQPQTVNDRAFINVGEGDGGITFPQYNMEKRNKIMNLVENEGKTAAFTFQAYTSDGVLIDVETVEAEGHNVSFVVIDEVPVFPGCEGMETNEGLRACFLEKVTQHVNAHLNTSLGKELGLEGINTVNVKFQIARDGTIEVLETCATHPSLQEEAERVVMSLPQMTPGKHNGNVVGVLHSLPISFRVSE